MKAFSSDAFAIDLPPGHKFPADKYRLVRERLAREGILVEADVDVPDAATDADLGRVHDTAYLARVEAGSLTERELRRIGFPWSPSLVERSRRSVGGTLLACRAALEDGLAVNLAGGTHHAFRDHGEGFCVFNDAAVAARAMQEEGRAQRIVIVDTDVHQGNGTAAILRGDDTVFTFSIHGANNFPRDKERSDLDIGLPDGTGDDAYLEALGRGLREALERARAELAIWIAGADAHEGDRFGRLALTKDGLSERDRVVLAACRGAGLPVAVTMGGGYGRRIEDTVDVHVATVALAVGRGRWPVR